MTAPAPKNGRADLEQLVEGSPFIAFRLTLPDSVTTYVSPNVERIVGFAPDEIIGVPGWWREHVAPADRTRMDEQAALAMAAHAREWETEAGFLRRDGEPQRVALVVRPEYDAAGTPVEAVAYAWDITDRRLTDDRFRRVVESVPNAIVIVDQRGVINLVNTQAERLFGYSRQEMVGKPVEMLLPASLRQGHPAHRAGYLDHPTTRAMGGNRDLHGLHRDGREIPVEVGLNPIESEDGTQVLASVIDISVRKAADAALRAAQAEAHRANLAKSEFLSRMSHELRTPLNAVLGFAQLLEMDELTAEQRDSLDHISQGGRYLLELVNEVLDISRIEAGQMTLSPEPVAMADLLPEVIGLISPLAGGRSITLDGTAAGCDAHVLADRQRLTQVLLNLLANAVKYNRPGGSVTVACAHVGGGVGWVGCRSG